MYAAASPWLNFRKKSPLWSFIVSRLITMVLILFFLGFAVFGLMELAPGDIVTRLMMQQVFSSAEGPAGNAQTLQATNFDKYE